MFNITVSEQCPIREVKLVNIKSDEEMNVNYNNNILLKGVVNGTENGLTIRNNIKVDTQFSFSILVTTWGEVTQRQDFNIGWYVNKPPELPSKPAPILLEVDYDNVRDGTDNNLFKYESPDAIDVEKDQIQISFSGLDKVPCQCIKMTQVGDGYKFVVYKQQITAADANTWNITITIKDDQTQPFVSPNEYN